MYKRGDPDRVLYRRSILAQCTDYNEEFKNIFLEQGILNEVDLEVIDVELFRNGREAGVGKFYDILSQRKGYFEILLNALKETRQEIVISVLFEDILVQQSGWVSKVLGIFRDDGELTYDKNSWIGVGNEFVRIYQGTFQRREVAVKVTKTKNNPFYKKDQLQKEIEIFKKVDAHQNVLRLIVSQKDAKKVLLAFELCNCNLEQHYLFSHPTDYKSIYPATISDLDIIQQILQGMRYIHSCGISHGNIQPKSILLRVLEGNLTSSSTSLLPIVQVKIANFKINKHIKNEDVGWWAPEIHLEFTKYTDVFSLGCLFYYILTAGKHPYGESTENRVLNIRNNMPSIDDRIVYPLYRGSISLIKLMLSHAKASRPSISSITAHFLLWSREKTLDFLVDVSNFLCDGETPQKKIFKKEIEERYRTEICGTHSNGWIHRIDSPHVKTYLLSNKRRTYKGDSVVELVRCIRNMKNHYENLPYEVKLIVGSLPDRFLTFWIKAFPYLIHHIWVVLQDLPHDDSNPLSKYYKQGSYINLE